MVIPAYNEETTITNILKQVDPLTSVREIVVVDDCSTDATAAIIESSSSPRVRLFRQHRNMGKTAAIAHGVREVTSALMHIQDADSEYAPTEIPFVIAPILSGEADVVCESRFLVGRATHVLQFYHYLANNGLTFLSNLFTNRNMTDIETYYRAFGTPSRSGGRFGFVICLTSVRGMNLKERIWEELRSWSPGIPPTDSARNRREQKEGKLDAA